MLVEMDDAKIEAWLSSDLPNGEEEEDDETEEHENNTGTASPPKADSGSTSIMPNALLNSALKATLVPSNEFLSQGKLAEKEEVPFLHTFKVPIDNYDTLHGLFRDLQKRLAVTSDPGLPTGSLVYQQINSKPELTVPISKAGRRK
jgi:hypothetical protein